tara:strand:- start:67 stop:513 length:447 start_codon:yes stop_codon:yes gene_type:complete
MFKGIVDRAFINYRNKIMHSRAAGIRGADSEFPEYHQCQVDPCQTLNNSWVFDTVHTKLGNVDYKNFSKDGVHVSTAIQKQIIAGNIDYLGIWKWLPNNRWIELKEGMTVEYEILDYVDAKEAIKYLNKDNRFLYPLRECVQLDEFMV